jgi:hypothetical protein
MSTPRPVGLAPSQLGFVPRDTHHVPVRWSDGYLRPVAVERMSSWETTA